MATLITSTDFINPTTQFLDFSLAADHFISKKLLILNYAH